MSGGKREIKGTSTQPRHRWRAVLLVLLALAAVGAGCAAGIRWYLNQSQPAEEENPPQETVSTEPEESEEPEEPEETEEITQPAQETGTPTEETAAAESEPAESESAESTEPDGQETGDDGEEDWQLLLVNRWNAIPDGYTVDELVTLSNGYQVDARIYPYLQEMFDEMRAEGVYPVVASGYRTHERQIEIINEKIESYMEAGDGLDLEGATAEAELWVAVPGTSEHETGLAVDINADGIYSAGYQVYEWLAEHAWEYGFILRYPEGKEDITATDYEPWHYRYVGKENAKLIQESGLCLEEYLGNTDQSDPYTYVYSGEKYMEYVGADQQQEE